ncbi:hypothetical protein CsSME_00007106 [Camellia sinensis var. sinensis]
METRRRSTRIFIVVTIKADDGSDLHSSGYVDPSKKWISSKAVVIALLICGLLATLASTASIRVCLVSVG